MTASDNGVSEQEILAQDRKRSRSNTLVALGIMGALLLVCCWFGLVFTAPVPDVEGLSEAEATEELKDAGFGAEIAEGLIAASEAADAEAEAEAEDAEPAEPGTVIAQSPEAGARVLKGTRVRITLAGGSGSGNGTNADPDGNGTSGSSIEPYVPSEAAEGSTYVPSSGTTPADTRPTIPSVGNMAEASAISTLRNAGYSVVVSRGPTTAGVLEGYVYAQEPPFGSKASRGTTVTIWVSTGPPTEGEYGFAPKP